MTVACICYALFTDVNVGKTGLTVWVDVDQIAKADGTRTPIVSDAAALEGINGYYYYRIANADLSLYDYLTTFSTQTQTVNLQQIVSLWSNYSANMDAGIAALPSLVSIVSGIWSAPTRLLSSITAIVNGVWDALAVTHNSQRSTGAAVKSLQTPVVHSEAP